MKIKIQKPIDTDVHFKYRCLGCGGEHWLSLNETKTSKFKIVCNCGKIFSPKKIKNIKVVYAVSTKKSTEDTKKEKPIHHISKDLLDKCTKLLFNYGFTTKEAQEMLQKAYQENPTEDSGLLLKTTLKLIGVKNE